MIVGIRVGFNAEFTHQRKYERGGHLNGCIPGAVNGISLDVGGKFKLSGNDEIYERKSIPSTFVFAYRLREVRYFKKDNSTTDMEFTKGATLHDLDGSRYASVSPSVTDTSYLGNDDEIEIDGIAGEDFEEDEEDTVIVDGCIMVDSVTVSVR
jgi:hypothetical protein